VAFSSKHEQPARVEHLLLFRCNFGLDAIDFELPPWIVLGNVRQLVANAEFNIAAQLDIRTAARHVGGDSYSAQPPRLRHNTRFTFMLAGVENLVLDAFLVEKLAEQFGFLDRHCAHQHRLANFVLFLDRLGNRAEFVERVLVELVFLIDPLDRNVGRDFDHIHLVDVPEFGSFRGGCAGHTRQLGVHAEVVLEGDRSHGLVLGLDLHPFLGFNRLMQAVRPAAAIHHAPGEFIDDNNLVVLHDIIRVALEHDVRFQRLVEVVDHQRVFDVVKVFGLQQTFGKEDPLDLVGPLFSQLNIPGFLVLFVPVFGDLLYHFVERDIKIGLVFSGSRDDQRRARLVDQDRVDFIDDRKIERTLHHLVTRMLHIVAQIIEAELVVGGVGYVGIIGFTALEFVEIGHDHTYREAQPAIQLAHPFGIALGEVIVHGNDVHALAFDCVEVSCQCRHKRLALARPHLRNFAAVEHDAADLLDIEMTHREPAPRLRAR